MLPVRHAFAQRVKMLMRSMTFVGRCPRCAAMAMRRATPASAARGYARARMAIFALRRPRRCSVAAADVMRIPATRSALPPQMRAFDSGARSRFAAQRACLFATQRG